MATSGKTYTQEEVDILLTRCKKDMVLWLYSRQLTFGTGAYQYCIEWLNEDMPKLEEIREKYDRKFLKSEGVEDHSQAFPIVNHYTMKYKILEPLATVLQMPVGSRSDIVKTFMKYTKEKGLNGPGQTIRLDESLQKALQTENTSITVFEIAKYTKNCFGEKMPVKVDTFDVWSDDETCSSCSE